MPPHEFPGAISSAGGSSQDRLIIQVPPDVDAQIVGGFISPGAVFIHRLHDDPVELAAHQLSELLGFGLAMNSYLRKCVSQSAQTRAGAWRINIANGSLHLSKSGF